MNIKIGKGGSGKISATKIIIIYEVILQGNGPGNYNTVDGVYTRSSGGTTTFDGPNGNYIQWSGCN